MHLKFLNAFWDLCFFLQLNICNSAIFSTLFLFKLLLFLRGCKWRNIWNPIISLQIMLSTGCGIFYKQCHRFSEDTEIAFTCYGWFKLIFKWWLTEQWSPTLIQLSLKYSVIMKFSYNIPKIAKTETLKFYWDLYT